MKDLTVGIVGMQGDIEEHIASVKHTFRDTGLTGDIRWINSAKI